ncbi:MULTISPECIES: hypothetical protein [Cyanophyceae]|uniref:hypothetical protein n=1 Tax=Cyanophyceae TaxID=3028117 RepID=UPI001689C798|nr:hypothetical protein [Trichocoleus sp. FACHB-40]MBD2002729.1 hypothetical protein [Trichocoleus sp. FACHB-40]
MATIKITNLYSTGSELFQDSESYLNDLTNEEMNLTGGLIFTPTPRSTPFCTPWIIILPPKRWY